jgi:hypothetical protein
MRTDSASTICSFKCPNCPAALFAISKERGKDKERRAALEEMGTSAKLLLVSRRSVNGDEKRKEARKSIGGGEALLAKASLPPNVFSVLIRGHKRGQA